MKRPLPRWGYGLGAVGYAVLAAWLFAAGDHPVVAWICAGSAVVGGCAALGSRANPRR